MEKMYFNVAAIAFIGVFSSTYLFPYCFIYLIIDIHIIYNITKTFTIDIH